MLVRIGALAFSIVAAGAASGGTVFDLLVPRPVNAVATGGEAPSADLTFRTVRGAVPDAPAAVAAEAYVLEIGEREAVATASDPRGERYARVTFDQLRALGGGKVPCGRIVDWPRLRWRGYLNDCGRNYLDRTGVKAILDVMALYKLNLFHWHLTDYHGWRLESKRHPGLQSEAAFYGRQVGRYYTQDDFREIVDYAFARGIRVMPEFDLPGHSTAFREAFGLKSMKDARDIAETKDPGPISTFHDWGRIRDVDWRRCDYIYVSDGIRVKDFITHDEKRPGLDRYPTDHFVCTATLEFD